MLFLKCFSGLLSQFMLRNFLITVSPLTLQQSLFTIMIFLRQLIFQDAKTWHRIAKSSKGTLFLPNSGWYMGDRFILRSVWRWCQRQLLVKSKAAPFQLPSVLVFEGRHICCLNSSNGLFCFSLTIMENLFSHLFLCSRETYTRLVRWRMSSF